MAANKISDLVSNPVFLSPQMAAQEGAETTSQILYANKFSGLPEVQMQGELLDLFQTKELNLTDTNFRHQLQHILEEYDSANGPWYIDGKNGILHIHNRKIAPSAFVYRYQDENGEVLKVQITTNWTTGSSSGTVASTISNNKVRDLSRFDIPTLDFSEDLDEGLFTLHRPLHYWEPNDNTRVAGHEHLYQISHTDSEGRVIIDGYELNAHRASQAWNAGYDLTPVPTPEETFRAEEIETRRKLKAHQDRHSQIKSQGGSTTDYGEDWLEGMVADPREVIDKWDEKIMREMLKSRTNPEKAEEMLTVFNKVKRQEVLTPAEQKLASTNIWLDDPELQQQLGTFEAPRAFVIKGTRQGPVSWGAYGGGGQSVPLGTPGTVVSALTVEELSSKLVTAGVGIKSSVNMGLAGGSTSVSAPPEIMASVRKAVKDAGVSPFGSTLTGIEVKILPNNQYEVKVRVIGKGSPVVTVMDYANFRRKRETPGVGGSKKAKTLALINSMRNRSRKAKHKEIEVQMLVIGRPSLEAGQYIDIYNIGQKYSGQWYIKTCVHQLDSNGYTCSLTLKRNQNTPDGTSVSVTRKRDGTKTGQKFQVNTAMGIIELSATDLSYAHNQALRGNTRTFQTFIRTAVYAQQQGIYGEGLKETTNAGDVHMNGTENPDLEYADTPAGKAATQAYNAEMEKRRAEAKAAKAKSKLKSKKK